jgi:DJ-1/PfpI family
MNTIETPITKEKVAALVADAFQDSEYFLPKIALQDQLGLDVEVISLKRDPIEIYSNFSRIGLLDVNKTIQEADPRDYIGVLIPGGARSPAPEKIGRLDLPRLAVGREVRYCQGSPPNRFSSGQGISRPRHPPDRRSQRWDLER